MNYTFKTPRLYQHDTEYIAGTLTADAHRANALEEAVSTDEAAVIKLRELSPDLFDSLESTRRYGLSE